MRKLTLLAGVGVGYVLGARAGREKYEQIVAKARELAGQPAVQDLSSKVQQTATTVADTAKAKANETVDKVNDKVASAGSGSDTSIDLTTDQSGYDTGAPMAGAAASDTV